MATTTLPPRSLRLPTRPYSEWWAWLVPPVAFVIVLLAPALGWPLLVAPAIAVPAIIVLSRYPGFSLVALIWFLPLQIPVLSYLYEQGAPAQLLKVAGYTKEGLVAAVFIAGAREVVRRRSRLDGLDKLILAYCAALTIYVVFPFFVSSQFFPRSGFDRLLGYRINAGFLLVFLACRHAPIGAKWRRRFIVSVIGAALLLAAIGVYQFIRPEWFSDFVLDDLGIPFFQLDVLEVPLDGVVSTFRWTQENPVRVGSLFVGPFDFADFLLLPAALLLVRLTRRAGRLRDVGFLAIIGGALLASQTRANIIALGVVVLLALAPSPNRLLANRLRILAIVLLAAVAFVPRLASSRLGGAEQSAKSTEGHVNEIQFGLTVLQEYPLGLGIGTAPAVSARSPDAIVVISDNSLLQVGNELGIGMMALFIAILVATVLALWRRSRGDPEDHLADGACLALIGLIIAGQFHHVFQTFAIAWPLWAAIGLALARRKPDHATTEMSEGSGKRSMQRTM
jgi:hypothetical protein